MKAKKETKPSNGQQQSEPETEENEDTAGETQLSETSRQRWFQNPRNYF